LVISYNLKAQCPYTFSGYVKDAATGNALPGVSVLLKKMQIGDITDENGHFLIKNVCKGSDSVSFSYFSYSKLLRKVVFSSDTSMRFSLHAGTTAMKAVMLSGEKPKETATTEVIDLQGKELASISGVSLGEALTKIVGVSALKTGPSIFKPVINGMYGNRVLIIDNGVRLEGQQWGAEHAPEIDLSTASKISVVKGAKGVRYGSDAIGGVVLVAPAPLRKKPGFDGIVDFAGFSNNQKGAASGIINFSPGFIKGLSFRAQGTLKKAGDSKTPDHNMGNTAFSEHDFSLASGYFRKKTELQIFYSQFASKIGILSASHIGNLTDLQKALSAGGVLDTSSFSYKINRPYQAIMHELFKASLVRKFRDFGKLSLIYARQFDNRAEYDKDKPYSPSLQDKPQAAFHTTTHTAHAVLDLTSKNNFTSTVGAAFIQQGNTTTGTMNALIPNFKSYAGGLFLIEQWKKNRFKIEGGLRYDYKWMKVYRYQHKEIISPDYTFSDFSGTLGAVNKFSDHFSLRTSIGSAFRPPSANELYSSGLHDGAARIEFGDTTLVPENAYNISLTASYKFPRIFGEIYAYNNYVKNYIFLKPSLVYDAGTKSYDPEFLLSIRGAFPVFRYTQIDAQFAGIDASFNDSISRHFIGTARVSLLKAYNRSAKEYLILTPATQFQYGFRYNVYWERLKNCFIQMNESVVLHKSKVPQYQDLLPPPPSYTVFTLEAGGRVFIGKQPIDLRFSIYNVFNTRYREYLNQFRYFTNDVGRNFVLRVKIPFDLSAN